MVYTWYILGYTMYIHQTGYTWYNLRYTMYIHQVYTWYIHGYTWYIIWCIYMVCTWYILVYPWIFLAFWNQILLPARAAGLIQCAHACGWSKVFIPRDTRAIAPGEKAAFKRLNPTAANVPRLSLVAAVTAAAAAVSRASFRFPRLVAGNDFNLGEGWGRGCLQDRWPMCRTA